MAPQHRGVAGQHPQGRQLWCLRDHRACWLWRRPRRGHRDHHGGRLGEPRVCGRRAAPGGGGGVRHRPCDPRLGRWLAAAVGDSLLVALRLCTGMRQRPEPLCGQRHGVLGLRARPARLRCHHRAHLAGHPGHFDRRDQHASLHAAPLPPVAHARAGARAGDGLSHGAQRAVRCAPGPKRRTMGSHPGSLLRGAHGGLLLPALPALLLPRHEPSGADAVHGSDLGVRLPGGRAGGGRCREQRFGARLLPGRARGGRSGLDGHGLAHAAADAVAAQLLL
mmetsp:Transcript_2702/g.8102  ORF Transcript_2702/g.8102 Transcript_2702/m.8102 type:complete len:278 (-) Transcript_2702:45-878(-)